MKRFVELGCCVVLTAAMIGGIAGCGTSSSQGNAVVQGTVTIDGALAQSGTVTFIPVKDGPVGVGTIDGKGTFSLRVGQGNRNDPNESMIPSGDYAVTVVVHGPAEKLKAAEGDEVVGPPPPGPRLTAAKYASKDTTDLKISVKSGRNVVPLELESSANDPVPEAIDDTEAKTEEVGEAAGESQSVDSATEAKDVPETIESDEPQPAVPANEGVSQ